jgi:phage antirepressor YoqD-like protein
MNDLMQGGRMTVREVAEVLGLDPRTIQMKVKELFPEIVVERQATYLSEAQVTAVKMACEKKFAAKTDLEKELIVQQALVYQQEKIKNLTEQLAIAEPKAEALDGISAGEGDITVRELAAILALPYMGENALLRRFREDGYLTRDGIPARQHIDRGLLYEKMTGNPAKPRIMITPKGLVHFSMKYAEGRCRAESADELRPCRGYRIGKSGGFWFQGIVDDRGSKRLSYSRDQGRSPAVCRACVKIIGKTAGCFYPRNYIFFKSPGGRCAS